MGMTKKMRERLESLKESKCRCGRGKANIDKVCSLCEQVMWCTYNINVDGEITDYMYHKRKYMHCQTRNCYRRAWGKNEHCDACIVFIWDNYGVDMTRNTDEMSPIEREMKKRQTQPDACDVCGEAIV